MSRALACLLCLLTVSVLACASDTTATSTVAKSGLYGPCGVNAPCATGLSCMPNAAAPTVFICTRACAPTKKCPGVLKIAECRAMNECEEGCCQINNIWGDGTKITCDGSEVDAVWSDGYCQPKP